MSRWEVGKSGPSATHRAELVQFVRAKDPAVGAALAQAFARLYPGRSGTAIVEAAPPLPPDPAALERSLIVLADALDVAPRRARAFTIDALRAVHAARFTVDDALAYLAPVPSPPSSSTA